MLYTFDKKINKYIKIGTLRSGQISFSNILGNVDCSHYDLRYIFNHDYTRSTQAITTSDVTQIRITGKSNRSGFSDLEIQSYVAISKIRNFQLSIF